MEYDDAMREEDEFDPLAESMIMKVARVQLKSENKFAQLKQRISINPLSKMRA